VESKLEFEYKKGKNPINQFLLRLGIFLVYLIPLFNDFFGSFEKYLILLFVLLCFKIIEIIIFNKKNKKALTLSIQNIYINFDNVQVDWKEVQDIKYVIRMFSSYIMIDLKNELLYIKKQKWYKRPRLYINKWKFKTPLVFNLENVKGETDENYKKITTFIKEHNLLSFQQ
jgi:hypothetical protein